MQRFNFKKIFYLDNWIIPLFIVILANASVLFNNNIKIFGLFIILLYFFIRRKFKFENALIFISIFWIVINIISSNIINTTQPYSLITVLSRLMKLLAIYFIVKLTGITIYSRFVRYAYVLVIISLILYLVQLIALPLMKSIAPLFQYLTQDVFSETGSWYSYFYMFNIWHPTRNSGFMWEPGAYAGILVFLITYQFSINNFKFDKYIKVFSIGLITTLSTAGYFALAVLVIGVLFKNSKKNPLLLLMLPILVYVAIIFYLNTDFMSDKVDYYLESGTNVWDVSDDGINRTSRLGFAMIVLDETLHWPFGHGVVNYSEFMIHKYGKSYGPGALSALLHQWGIIGLFGVLYFIFKFYRQFQDTLTSLIFTLSMCIILFSNPDIFLYIIFSIVFFMIAFKKQILFEKKLRTNLLIS